MVATPAATPVTMPVEAPTVAVPVALLLQVPPLMASVRVMVAPVHTVEEPEIADGADTTVTVILVLQPVGNVYTMELVPGETPVTIPEEEPTVATPVAVLVQVPPAVASVSVVV